jgi:hypothetical protein
MDDKETVAMTARSSFFALLAGVTFAMSALGAEVRGVISKVDPQKGQLVLEGRSRGARGTSMTFVLDKDTQILIGRQPGKLGDLPVGKRARVVYEDHAGRLTALRITVAAVLSTQATPKTKSGAVISAEAGAVAGTLRRVALTDREIVIIGPGPKGGPDLETTLFVPNEAKITRGEKAMSFDDLKEGDQVVAYSEKRDGFLQAKTIEVGTATVRQAPPAQQARVERVRQILKMVDSYLEELSKK